MKNLRHRVQVNITKKNGTKAPVLESHVHRVPERLLRLILGKETRTIVVLSSGDSVKNVIISEEKGE